MTLSGGKQLHDFAAKLYPICRSITGSGVRETLRLIGAKVPVKVTEIPSGSNVFDWEVPLEWSIEDASVEDADGRRVVDFQAHNLHLVGYSEPIDTTVSLDELAPHLHVCPQNPDWIPYRTSYYRRSWGFCMRGPARDELPPGKYRVRIKSALAHGSLTYGEVVLPGRSREEVVFFAHVCHPSLANDNTSGLSIATALAQWIAAAPRRYTYRFVFAPATIGALCWLKRNERRLGLVRHGLVLALLGDPGPLTYKMSRTESNEIDSIAQYVLAGTDSAAQVVPFSPYGYDERQLCSPGFNLPFGRLTRSVNAGFPEYHSSGDDLSLVRPECLEQSFTACQRIVTVLEGDAQFVNLSPKGEPRLGKRGLYGAVGGVFSPSEREHAMLWVLNQSDGAHRLLDVARRSGLDFSSIVEAAAALENAGLLKRLGDGRVAAGRVPRGRGAARGRRKAPRSPLRGRK
jgi:aminopeptidase-like protein